MRHQMQNLFGNYACGCVWAVPECMTVCEGVDMLTLKGIRIKRARVSMLCTRLVSEVNHVEAPLDILANDIIQRLGDLSRGDKRAPFERALCSS